MYFLQKLHEQKFKGTFFIDPLKTGIGTEFLISSGAFFQTWLALYAVLSEQNFSVFGFLDSIWGANWRF